MEHKSWQILAINPGSTSTKIGWFANQQPVFLANLRHGDAEMARFSGQPVLAQLDYRERAIRAELAGRAADLTRLNAVAGRGGLLKPLASGAYLINQAMLADLAACARGEHPSNLGALLATRIAEGAPAFVVDPVSVDEWPPLARLSGMAGLERECLSHALNTKAVARRFAAEQGRSYADLRLVVAHLGSGISVSAHENGRMVDVTNSRDEGAFSMERAGGVPASKLIEWSFGGASRKEIESRLFQQGGAFSYLGTRELQELLRRRADGDEPASLVFEAMVYQIAKEIGAMAAALSGRVDAILVTGGMAHASEMMEALGRRVQWIAPVRVYPGEDELLALAEGALRVLRGEEQAREYV
jgi:butyrate kinase